MTPLLGSVGPTRLCLSFHMILEQFGHETGHINVAQLLLHCSTVLFALVQKQLFGRKPRLGRQSHVGSVDLFHGVPLGSGMGIIPRFPGRRQRVRRLCGNGQFEPPFFKITAFKLVRAKMAWSKAATYSAVDTEDLGAGMGTATWVETVFG